MHRRVLVVLLLAAPLLSGCLQGGDFWERVTGNNPQVFATDVVEGIGRPGEGPWNTHREFRVTAEHTRPVEVRIVASGVGDPLVAHTSPEEAVWEDDVYSTEAVVLLPDGVWDITFFVDGRKWGTKRLVHIDATPPEIHGLELLGDAEGGNYEIGADAIVEAGATVAVREQASGFVLATSLPYVVRGLTDGIHVFDVVARDRAGNEQVYTVQVRTGSAVFLPAGEFTVGIVARFSSELRLWDISAPQEYLGPAQARAAVGDRYLGAGFRIEPDDAQVQAVVADVVDASMTTAEAALALYRWMFDNLRYDEARLEADDLLSPAGTIANGGGVCRDLAALYTSLLRAAGVPARLVTGYLGGGVNGFHAWVEFYGGHQPGNPSPWVPVDVSAVDGEDWVQVMLQAFAVQRPDYLTLRVLPPEAEVEGWATALRVSYPQGVDVEFGQALPDEHQSPVHGDLCVDLASHARAAGNGCQGFSHRISAFPLRALTVLDYGVLVMGHAGGTMDVTVTLAYPVPDDQPGGVEFVVYGGAPQDWDAQAVAGKVVLRLS